MKKIANCLLAIVLLIATTGVTLHKHFCMGRLQSIAVFEHAKNCSGAEESDPMPCCENVSQELKVEEITQVSFDFDGQTELFEIAILHFILFNEVSLTKKEKLTSETYAPPPPGIDNLQAYQQVFII